jgi:hypothetical protein
MSGIMGLRAEGLADWKPALRLERLGLRLLLLASVLIGSVFCADAQSGADLLAGRIRARGVATAFYAGSEQPPSLILRAESVYTDYQRKGFFRIGLLPVAVMEGVTVELHHPEFMTNSLAQLHQWFGPQGAKALELRRVTFLVSGYTTNHLEAARARVAPQGRIELLDGISFMSGTNLVRAPRGALQVTGEHSGELILETTPPRTHQLFAHTETNNPLNKERLR